MTSAFQLVGLSFLRIHPLLANVPLLPKDDPAFQRLCDAILDRKALARPLKVTASGRVVDGLEEFKAAQQCGLFEVHAQIVPDEEAASIFLEGLLSRKQRTKSAVAYIAYPLMKEAHQESLKLWGEKVQKGQSFTIGHGVADRVKVEDFAEQIGVSKSLFKYAAQVHAIFADDPEYKAQMEPRILAEPHGGEHEDTRPIGLGAVIAGYGGRLSTLDLPKYERSPANLFKNSLYEGLSRFRKASADNQSTPLQAAREVSRTMLAKWDKEEKARLADFLSALACDLRRGE